MSFKHKANAGATITGFGSFIGGVALMEASAPTLMVAGGIVLLVGIALLSVAMSYW